MTRILQVLVFVVPLVVGVSFAQFDSWREANPAAYDELRSGLDNFDLADYQRIRAAIDDVGLDGLNEVLGALTGEGFSSCAFVDGGDGTPRLGGGSGGVDEVWGEVNSVLNVAVLPTLATFPSQAIVILDEFDETLFSSSPGVSFSGGELVAVVEQQLINTLQIAGASGGAVPLHGHLVLYHVLRILHNSGFDVNFVGQDQGVSNAWRFEITNGEQTQDLLIVDFAYSNLTTLQGATAFIVSKFSDLPAVINMSWGLVDCRLSEMYTANGLVHTSFLTYIHDLLNMPGSAAARDALKILCELVLGTSDSRCQSNDVFQTVFLLITLDVAAERAWNQQENGLLANEQLTNVASSGNQELPFPMPPAAWSGVYGVAACTPMSAGKAKWSNKGDFIASEDLLGLGAFFIYDSFNASGGGYWGTSFAAPYAALMIASNPATSPPQLMLMC